MKVRDVFLYGGGVLCAAIGAICISFSHAVAATITFPGPGLVSIQNAITTAGNGDEVVVEDGTYYLTESIDFGGKQITLRSRNGAENCIIDGNSNAIHAFYFHSGETSGAVVDGFTIQNFNNSAIYCYDTSSGLDRTSPTITNCTISGNTGGGIYCYGSTDPAITNCTISGNSGGGIGCYGSSSVRAPVPSITGCTISGNTASSGGGIFCSYYASPTITNCDISGNTAANEGGGIYCSTSYLDIIDCTISGNSANSGGGLACDGFSAPTIANCTISGNTATDEGGGIYLNLGSGGPLMANCTLSGNSAQYGGGIALNRCNSYSFITNCTISGNTAYSGGGINCRDSSYLNIINGIVWDNPTSISSEIYVDSNSYVLVSYSDVEGGYAGESNIDSDPLFMDAAAGDYRLKAGSPGIDAGNNSVVTQTTDLQGYPRIVNGTVDMGAYEAGIWQSYFAVDTRETPYVGDFNGDGMTDIITFTRDNPLAMGDVYVALSDGNQFGPSSKWHDWFAVSRDETVVIGDYNGDGVDDIATWLGKTTKEVYVAISYGYGMDDSVIWIESIGVNEDDVLKAGDVDGDGRDDLVLFDRRAGKVYVARSNGNGFNSPQPWHNWFAVSAYERPDVGDVDGDGMTDIITFATNSPTAQGDVYIALSNGNMFGDGVSSEKWHDWFSVDPAQVTRIADLDGDGRDDFLTFMPSPSAQVYGVYSEGSFLSDNVLWTESFAPSDTDVPYAGDVNGDGKADLIGFYQDQGRVYVLLTP